MLSKKTKLDRITKGICIQCGNNPAHTSSKCCTFCIKRKTQYVRNLVNKRISSGLCSRCSKNLLYKNTKTCKICSDKKVIYSRKRKDELKKNNLCVQCGKNTVTTKIECDSCSNRINKTKKALRQKKKKEIYKQYGNACSCCGETKIEFLTIDHKDGNGGKLRKSGLHARGNVFIKWIFNNNFPDSLQLLCWNCNLGKYHSGDNICPHNIK